MEGAEEITNDKMGREFRENETKNNTQHRAVQSDRTVREREREKRKYSSTEATFGTIGQDIECPHLTH